MDTTQKLFRRYELATQETVQKIAETGQYPFLAWDVSTTPPNPLRLDRFACASYNPEPPATPDQRSPVQVSPTDLQNSDLTFYIVGVTETLWDGTTPLPVPLSLGVDFYEINPPGWEGLPAFQLLDPRIVAATNPAAREATKHHYGNKP